MSDDSRLRPTDRAGSGRAGHSTEQPARDRGVVGFAEWARLEAGGSQRSPDDPPRTRVRFNPPPRRHHVGQVDPRAKRGLERLAATGTAIAAAVLTVWLIVELVFPLGM